MLAEIRLIREQMKSDFDFMIKGFVRQRDSTNEVAKTVGKIGSAFDEVRSAVTAMSRAVDSMGKAVDSMGKAVDSMGKAVDSMAKAVVQLQGSTEEARVALEGYMVRSEEKFDRLIAIVEGQEERLEKVEEQASLIPSLETRLRALEG